MTVLEYKYWKMWWYSMSFHPYMTIQMPAALIIQFILTHDSVEGSVFKPRQRWQTTWRCWPRQVDSGNANHTTPHDGTEYHQKTPVPVVPPSCQHPLWTLRALVPSPNLCTLCPLVITHNPYPFYLFIDLQLQKSTLPVWIYRSKAQSVLDSFLTGSWNLYTQLNRFYRLEDWCAAWVFTSFR